MAQVHGRDELNDENKAKYDSKYAHNISLKLDFGIFLKTIFDVIQSKGVHDGK